MSDETSAANRRIDEHQFTLVRKGYDKREVKTFLEDLEQAFRDLEGHSRRTAQRVTELERDLAKARATEKVSVDNAMMAVFDAKDRILDRAQRKAAEIEEEARREAATLLAAASASVGAGAPDHTVSEDIESARAQADEVLAAAHREAERIRSGARGEGQEEFKAQFAELEDRLRRSQADGDQLRTQLDDALRRASELEARGGLESGAQQEYERRLAETEGQLRGAREDIDRLRHELQAEHERVAELRAVESEVETASREYQRRITETDEWLRASRADAERLREELRAERNVVTELRAAGGDTAQIEAKYQARVAAIEEQLLVARTESAELRDRLASAQAADSGVSRDDLERLAAALESERANAEVLRFQLHMTGAAAVLAADDEQRASTELAREMGRAIAHNGAADAAAEIAEAGDALVSAARQEADEIKAKAEVEAAVVRSEAEDEAALRAAKVIAAAREEAKQVREAATELTARAEDARAAALRARIEADEILERRRTEAKAAEEIVSVARRTAEQLIEEARTVAEEQARRSARFVAEANARAEAILEAAEVAAPSGAHDGADLTSTVDLDALGSGEEAPSPRVSWPVVSEPDESADPEVDDGEEEETSGEKRESRYRSRSAQLPRIGGQARSSMATMANLRKKSSDGKSD